MAVTSAVGFPSKGIDFTQVTDTSADFAAVANSTYFYNLADKIVRYKNSTGTILEIFAPASGGGGIHALVKPIIGRRVVQSIVAGSITGANFTASRLVLTPFMPANTFTISEILMNSNGPVAGSLCRLLIYSDNNGVPDAKLYESADLNLSTANFKIALTTFTFNAGTTYWLGFHGGTTVSNIVQNQPASLYSIANAAATYTDTMTIYYVTATLGSAPANITSPTAAFGNAPWIALTPA